MCGVVSGSDVVSSDKEDLVHRATAASGESLSMPRAVLFFAHPDDEVVALGGRFRRLRNAHFVHITDGAPADNQDGAAQGFESREAYRAAREQEFAAALSHAGLAGATRECLGYIDQTAGLHLEDLTRKVSQRIAAHRPEVIFTHPYEGGHPDHDACAFAVHHALGDRQASQAPLIIEAPFYHLRHNSICIDEFLPAAHSTLSREYVLSAEERRSKLQLLACFPSQNRTLQQFSCKREQYRIAPEYDFLRPPHTPPVFYDYFPWGMTSGRFCELAKEAETQLRDREAHP